MAASWRLMTLVAVFFCLVYHRSGQIHVVATDLDEIKAMLSNVTRVCQGISNTLDEQQVALEDIRQSLRSVVGGPISSQPASQLAGPCHPDNHVVIDDGRRAAGVEYSGPHEMCDQDIQPGWKRFLLNNSNAVIPTSCVPIKHCHTDAPTWVNLQRQPLPKLGEQVEAIACSHWTVDCCEWRTPIIVHNCGDFFVYNVQPLPACNLTICVEPQEG